LNHEVLITWQSGKLMREQQPILKKLKLLFLFNPLMDGIDTTHAMRLWTHDRSMKAGIEIRGHGSKDQLTPA
jgi:phosphatidylserine decarboxylase